MSARDDIVDRVDELRNELVRTRKCGEVVLRVSNRASGSARAAADAAVVEAGGNAIADRWLELSRADAERVIAALLKRDLAYGTSCMERTHAEAFAQRIMALLLDSAQYLTNGRLGLSHAGLDGDAASWQAVTRSTFDSSVVAVTDQMALVFWVAEED